MPDPEKINTRSVTAAMFWSALERVGQQGVMVVVQLVLARLLGPEAFGLVAMVTIFYAVAQGVVDSGLSQALVQKKRVDPIDGHSMFYVNVALGVAMAGLLCAASPVIAWFYERPVLLPMTCCFALIPLVNSFGLVQESLLRRALDYRRLMIATLPATLVSGVVGVAMALLGFGVWALVAQMLTLRVLWVLMIWRVSDWRPARAFSLDAVRRMFGFGSKVMAEGILNVIFDNIYFLVIGKVFDALTLGLFFNARKLQMLVSTNLSAIMARVAFPVFSQIQDDSERMRKGLRRAVRLLALFNGLLCALMAALADPLFRGVLGREWIGSIPYFQWLAVVALFYPFSALNLSVLMAKGRSDLFLLVGMVKRVLIVVNLVVCLRYGVQALVYGMAALALISFLINAYFTGRFLRFSAWRQLREAAPYVAVAGLCWAAMAALSRIGFGLPHGLIAVVQVVVGVSSWLALCYACRLKAFEEAAALVRSRVKRPAQAAG